MQFNVLRLYRGVAALVALATSASVWSVGAADHHLALPADRATVLVSDHFPNFNIEGLCKATAADDAAAGLALAQSVESCLRDETAAKQQLVTIWEQNAGPARNECEAAAATGLSDSQSYVDLLTCMQMAGFANAGVQATTLRGGSKTRSRK